MSLSVDLPVPGEQPGEWGDSLNAELQKIVSAVNSVESAASAAQGAAAAASSEASSASSAASSASSIALAAVAAAESAETAALAAQTAAEGAQTAAEGAQTAAEGAATTASSAEDIASDAATAAAAAATAAAAAQTAAEGAQTAAEDALAAAESIAGEVAEVSDTIVAELLGADSEMWRAADARYATLDALADLEAQAASIEELDGTLPQFRRVGDGSPVFDVNAQNPAGGATAAGSIYWPWIIDARAILGEDALDEFYMYYSTDHAGAHEASGIWLATGPTELGPWTGRGRVWRDDVSGAQTETPTVYPDPTGAAKLVMLYQQQGVSGAVGSQSTMWATSDDGVTWTRGGIAIDVSAWMSGDGHTGYARAARIGGAVYAHHLRGGNMHPHFGLSVSYDGRRFHHVHMQGYARDLLPDGRRVEWNTGDVISWRGRLVWVGLCSDFVSGSTPKNARIAVAPISPDLRQLLAPPVYQLYPTQGDENTNYRSLRTFRARDGRLLLYYQSGGAFYVAEAI